MLDAIHASAEHIPLRTSIVLQFHRDLYSFTATPGSPFQTPAAMDELHERFGEAIKDGGHAPLLLTGAYVFDFLMIHPFNDGNGRLSRLLTLLLLYHAGHGIGRFISLEKLIEESKETYYESLERSTAGWEKGEHDIWPWLNYFLGILNAAYKEFEARAGELTGGRGSKTMRIKQFVQSGASDVFTFDEIHRALPDVSADHIRAELRKLRDAGIVESPGRGRKKWRRTHGQS